MKITELYPFLVDTPLTLLSRHLDLVCLTLSILPVGTSSPVVGRQITPFASGSGPTTLVSNTDENLWYALDHAVSVLGPWLVHCHIDWHLGTSESSASSDVTSELKANFFFTEAGLAAVFAEDPSGKQSSIQHPWRFKTVLLRTFFLFRCRHCKWSAIREAECGLGETLRHL